MNKYLHATYSSVCLYQGLYFIIFACSSRCSKPIVPGAYARNTWCFVPLITSAFSLRGPVLAVAVVPGVGDVHCLGGVL